MEKKMSKDQDPMVVNGSDIRYLQQHGIAAEVEKALSQLMIDLPDDPLQQLLETFEKVVEARNQKKPAVVPALGIAPSIRKSSQDPQEGPQIRKGSAFVPTPLDGIERRNSMAGSL